MAFHFNHATASIAAAIAYVATVLIVMAATSHMDADMNDIFFLCHLGTAVCLATYWPLDCSLRPQLGHRYSSIWLETPKVK